MYDSVNFRLRQFEAGNVDFLSETPCYFDVTGEHNFRGETVVSGSLNGLKVSVNRYQIKISEGSLCKWFLGDNFKAMGRGDTQRAIEKLSDILHLPISKASVTRIDIAQNFITKYPPEVYLSHLGLLKYHKRCPMLECGTLYYNYAGGRLCFYDKNREQKNKGEPIPELYKNRNVLRYEQRYTQRLATQLKVSEVTGALLYDEAFYIGLVKRWHNNYRSIQKINDITLNFQSMRTKQELYKMGVLSLIKEAGGEMEMINQINEAQKMGTLTKKQAFDLRQTVKDACKIKDGFTTQNEAIKELDKKIKEAVRFYR